MLTSGPPNVGNGKRRSRQIATLCLTSLAYDFGRLVW